MPPKRGAPKKKKGVQKKKSVTQLTVASQRPQKGSSSQLRQDVSTARHLAKLRRDVFTARLGYVALGAVATTAGYELYKKFVRPDPLRQVGSLISTASQYPSSILQHMPELLAVPRPDFQDTILPVFLYLSQLSYVGRKELMATLNAWGPDVLTSVGQLRDGKWACEYVCCGPGTPCAFILYVMNGTFVEVYISARGSSSTSDLWTDMQAQYLSHPSDIDTPCGGYVHKGFYPYKQCLIRQVKAVLQSSLPKILAFPRFYMTGHSLGGALATYMTPMVRVTFPASKVYVFTFAAPKVGDCQFCSCLLSPALRPTLSLRVYNSRDVVPRFPSNMRHLDQCLAQNSASGATITSLNIASFVPDLPDRHGRLMMAHLVFVFRRSGPRFYSLKMMPSLLEANRLAMQRLPPETRAVQRAALARRSFFVKP